MENEIIKIGDKSALWYVAIARQKIKKGLCKIIILARGKQILKAIDAAQILMVENQPKQQDISISGESFVNNGKNINISAVKIRLIW